MMLMVCRLPERRKTNLIIQKVRTNENNAISLSKSMSTNYYMNMQYSLNYARKFGVHDVTGMALVQRDNWQEYAADLPYNMLGVSACYLWI